jgi:protein-disulfide isomerase
LASDERAAISFSPHDGRISTEREMLKAFLMAVPFVLPATAQAAPTPDDAVAFIDGKAISQSDLDERAAPQLRELNAKIFEVKEQTLREMIDEHLLHQEAGRLKISMQQLLEREVDSHVAEPTQADVDKYYLEIKDRMSRPLEELRPKIIDYLTETQRRAAFDSYLSRLRSREKVVVLLAPPRASVAIDETRVRGPVDAPITIVEFSDFECPYCGRVEDTLRQLQFRYANQLRLAYRDFPMDFHPRAEPAAQASRCALAQGKYWPYHDLLFANQQHLESSDLSKYAVQLEMDAKKFDGCIAQKTFRAEVQRDLDEGQKLGIAGTPAFYINGMVLSGAVPLEEFERLIDRELERIKSASEFHGQAKRRVTSKK